jgi:2-polyprenyl-3-methyl-5-hydroxy-6-metoxy-1,4-benzoquinol methylase
MIDRCPLCGHESFEPVFVLASAPLVPLVRDPQTSRRLITAKLDIVGCNTCGHLFNRAFSADRCKEMYTVDFLTNRPVHPSMHAHLEQIAQRLDERFVRGKCVLEIGAGTGHFARILAALADSVLVIEPSRALRKEMVPEPNIRLINASFSPALCSQPIDLIICRQVLEHVADPIHMLREMRHVLTSDGMIYVEVPRAEFIESSLAIIELHNAHVQYFHERTFPFLASKASLEVVDSWSVKDGHDMGFLLRATDHARQSGMQESVAPYPLREAILQKYEAHQRTLQSLPTRGALYGANWQGESFFWLYGDNLKTSVMLDDNESYEGYHVFSADRAIPIQKPGKDIIEDLDYLVITAHLHVKVIGERVRAAGFRGKLFEAISLAEV